MGWVVHRQAFLYAQEYGLDSISRRWWPRSSPAFIKTFDAKHERCWIAEREGAVVGSVFLVRGTDTVAKLRLLYVEAGCARPGHRPPPGGRVHPLRPPDRLSPLTLWTNDILISARRIYQEAGFQLVAEERHHSFGHDLVGQNWDLDLYQAGDDGKVARRYGGARFAFFRSAAIRLTTGQSASWAPGR